MDVRFTDYMTIKEASAMWGVSTRRVLMYCNAERIPGAVMAGHLWLIPRDAVKPSDGRMNNRRQPKKEGDQ